VRKGRNVVKMKIFLQDLRFVTYLHHVSRSIITINNTPYMITNKSQILNKTEQITKMAVLFM
jgi:hypothetical protein